MTQTSTIAVKYLQSGNGESAIVCAANTNLWCAKYSAILHASNYYFISRPGSFGFAKQQLIRYLFSFITH